MLRYRRLANEGTRSSGFVTAQIENLQVTYTYFVNGRQYSGIAPTGMAGVPRYGSLTPGQKLGVVYLDSEPSVSTANEPIEMMQREKDLAVDQAVPVGVFSGVVLVLIGVIIRLTKGSHYRGMPKAVLLKWL